MSPAKIPRMQEAESSPASDEDSHSDEEAPEKDAVDLPTPAVTSPSTTKPSPPLPKTRSCAKHIVEINLEDAIKVMVFIILCISILLSDAFTKDCYRLTPSLIDEE